MVFEKRLIAVLLLGSVIFYALATFLFYVITRVVVGGWGVVVGVAGYALLTFFGFPFIKLFENWLKNGLEQDVNKSMSPESILSTISKKWKERGDDINLVIQDILMSDHRLFRVHAKHVPTSRTVTLFSVVHRLNAHYPARIYLAENAVFGGLNVGTNCDTPLDLRRHLTDVFNQCVVQSGLFGPIKNIKDKQVE